MWRTTSDKLREMKGLIGLLFPQETCFPLRKVTNIITSRSIGEARSAGGTVRPDMAAGPSGLNIKQTHHDQGIQLLKV